MVRAYEKEYDEREKLEVINCFTQSKDDFKKIGFDLIPSKRPYHVVLVLPKGWHSKAEPGVSGVVFFYDKKGRKRGAFSEDSFHGYSVHLFCRYFLYFSVINEDPDWRGDDFGELQLLDYNLTVIKTFGQFWYFSRDYESFYREAEEYLAKNYPHYDDPLAYWD